MLPGLCLDQTPGRQRNIECGERNAPPVSPVWLDREQEVTQENKHKETNVKSAQREGGSIADEPAGCGRITSVSYLSRKQH